MDAHAMNIIQGRQFPGFPIPTGLPISVPFPLPTGKPGRSTSSSSSSTSTSSSASLSTSSSISSSSSSSTSVSSSSSTTSSVLTISTTTSSSSSDTVFSTSTQTVTAIADAPTDTPSATASPSHSSFLQNKVLSGVVFGIAGVIGLAILIMVATFALRRRRSKMLLEDAVSFDPVNMGTGAGYADTLETGQVNRSRASTSTGRNSNWSNGPEVRNTPAYMDYAPSPRSYLPPSANLASYSYTQQGQYSSNQQPYPQSFNWGASAQQSNPYGLPTVEEVDTSRRSRSSSTEIKFAPTAVPPPRQLGR